MDVEQIEYINYANANIGTQRLTCEIRQGVENRLGRALKSLSPSDFAEPEASLARSKNQYYFRE